MIYCISMNTLKYVPMDDTNKNINTSKHKMVGRDNLSTLDRFAIWITNRAGSMGFFIIIFVWTFSWLVWNVFAPIEHRFDPYPAFVLWLFVSNMIQLFLTPLILVGQNLQEKHAERRAQADFEINIKAEHEIKTILTKLEEQDVMLKKLLEKE